VPLFLPCIELGEVARGRRVGWFRLIGVALVDDDAEVVCAADGRAARGFGCQQFVARRIGKEILAVHVGRLVRRRGVQKRELAMRGLGEGDDGLVEVRVQPGIEAAEEPLTIVPAVAGERIGSLPAT
jgi:hypothetical protein